MIISLRRISRRLHFLTLLLLLSTLLPAPLLAQFNYTVSGGTATITQYTGAGGQVDIPATLGGFPVSHIGGWSFRSRTTVTGISIPASVTRIGTNAFVSCSALTQVQIPETVTQIDDGAFADCQSLTNLGVSSSSTFFTSVGGVLFDHSRQHLLQFPAGLGGNYSIPDSVRWVESMAFLGCKSLTHVTVPSSVGDLGSRAFEGCSSLASLELSSNLTALPDRAFAYCSNLSNITIPEGVTNIGSLAFYSNVVLSQVTLPQGLATIELAAFADCLALGSVDFPSTLRVIGNSAFEGCSKLSSAEFRDGISEIGHSSFRGCSSLTNLIWPESLTVVGQGAFALCTKLPSVRIPEGVTLLDEFVFEACASLREVSLPATLTNIQWGAFTGCSALSHISLPDNLDSLGNHVFFESGLVTLTIPSGVTSIGGEALANGTNLTSVYFLGDSPPDPGILFSPNSQAAIFYLPGTSGWSSSYGGLPTQEWIPKALDSGLVADHFEATVPGPNTSVIIMEASTTLNGPTWQPVATNTLGLTSITSLRDPRPTLPNSQFYRFRSP